MFTKFKFKTHWVSSNHLRMKPQSITGFLVTAIIYKINTLFRLPNFTCSGIVQLTFWASAMQLAHQAPWNRNATFTLNLCLGLDCFTHTQWVKKRRKYWPFWNAPQNIHIPISKQCLVVSYQLCLTTHFPYVITSDSKDVLRCILPVYAQYRWLSS